MARVEGGAVIVETDWPGIKDQIDNRNINFKFEEDATAYEIFAIDGQYFYTTIIYKTGQAPQNQATYDTWRSDFETNYKNRITDFNSTEPFFLTNVDGYSVVLKDGATPTSNDGYGIAVIGYDGTNYRMLKSDSSGRPVFVGAGTAGLPSGGVVSIQGVASGTNVPISGTVTANAGSGNFAVVQATASNLLASVGGLGASGAAVVGNPVRIGGSDGTNTQDILIDSSGRQIVVGAAANTAAPVGNPVLIAGSDGSSVRTIRTATDGTVRIDPTGTTTQPISGTVTANAGSGTFTVAGTVTANIGTTGGLALDSTLAKLTIAPGTAIGSNTLAMVGGYVTTVAPTYTDGNINPLSLTTAGALRIDGSGVTQPISGTVTANQGTSPWVNNITQFGGSNVVTGTGASGAGIPRVTVSNDSNILATQSGTWTVAQGAPNSLSNKWPVQITDGTNTMPTGDAVGRAIFEKITDGTNTAAVKAASTAAVATDPALVVAVSPNNIIPTTISNFGVVVSSGNSTTTPLGSGATFTGTAEQVTSYQEIDINIAGSPSNAPGTLYFEFSPDGTNWDVSVPLSLTGLSAPPQFLRIVLPWFRVRYVNGSTVQTSFRLTVLYHRTGAARLTRFLNQSIDNTEPVENVRAIVAGSRFNNSSQFINKLVEENVTDADNKLLTGLTNGSILNFTTDFTTDIFTSNGHGLQDGYAVHLTTTGTLPAPLTSSTVNSAGTTIETIYWVINSTTNTFQLSTSPGGSAINLTDNGTGTHSFQNRGQYLGLFKDVSQVGSVLEFFFSDINPAVVRNEWSNDGISTNTDLLSTSNVSIETTTLGGSNFYIGLLVNNTIIAPYYRVRIVNGPSNQGPLSGFYSFISKNATVGSVASLNASLSDLSISQLVRSVIAGYTPDGYFKNIKTQGLNSVNSSNTPLVANAIFRGTWVEWQEDYSGMMTTVNSDVLGTLVIEYSQEDSPIDGYDTSVTDSVTLSYDPSLTPLLKKHTTVQSRWVRTKYINGVAAQSLFNLECVFMVTPAMESKFPLTTMPTYRNIADLTQSFILSEQTETANSYVRVKTTRNSNNKDGLDVHVTGFEDDVAIQPVTAAQARQFVVGASVVQIDAPTLSTPGKRRAVGIQTRGQNWTAYGFSNSITFTSNSMLIPPNSFKSIALDGYVNLWAITEQTGGTQTVQNLNGSSASGTATSPSNALTSDDSRASITAAGQTIRVTGISYTPTASSTIQSVRIGCEARKQPGQSLTVSHNATVTQASTSGPGNVGSITSNTVTGGANRLIVAAISRINTNAAITSITNTGTALTWTQAQTITVGVGRLGVWYAYGNPGATFTVTANFAQTATNCHIAVSTYDGANSSSPISFSGTNSGSGTAVSGPGLTGANKQLSYMAVIMGDNSSTPGTGYTERSDEHTTGGPGVNRDGLTTETKALTTGGTETATCTLANSVAWGSISLIINNAPATDPVVTLSYETPSGTAGPTSNNFTYNIESDTTQYSDITGDRSWVQGDITSAVLIATGQTISGANLEVDRLWIEVTDTTGNTTRVSVEQYAGSS